MAAYRFPFEDVADMDLETGALKAGQDVHQASGSIGEAAAIDDQAVSFASRVVDPVDKGALAARLAKPHGSAALSRPVAA